MLRLYKVNVIILTQSRYVRNINGRYGAVVFAETVLYDKRREDCYRGIPICVLHKCF